MEGTFEKNIKALIYKIEKQNNLDVKNFKSVIDNYISIDGSEINNDLDFILYNQLDKKIQAIIFDFLSHALNKKEDSRLKVAINVAIKIEDLETLFSFFRIFIEADDENNIQFLTEELSRQNYFQKIRKCDIDYYRNLEPLLEYFVDKNNSRMIEALIEFNDEYKWFDFPDLRIDVAKYYYDQDDFESSIKYIRNILKRDCWIGNEKFLVLIMEFYRDQGRRDILHESYQYINESIQKGSKWDTYEFLRGILNVSRNPYSYSINDEKLLHEVLGFSFDHLYNLSFNVVLTSSGSAKISVIKVIREHTGLGIKEAKELVDSAPKVIKKGVSASEAEEIKVQLEEAGASVELKNDSKSFLGIDEIESSIYLILKEACGKDTSAKDILIITHTFIQKLNDSDHPMLVPYAWTLAEDLGRLKIFDDHDSDNIPASLAMPTEDVLQIIFILFEIVNDISISFQKEVAETDRLKSALLDLGKKTILFIEVLSDIEGGPYIEEIENDITNNYILINEILGLGELFFLDENIKSSIRNEIDNLYKGNGLLHSVDLDNVEERVEALEDFEDPLNDYKLFLERFLLNPDILIQRVLGKLIPFYNDKLAKEKDAERDKVLADVSHKIKGLIHSIQTPLDNMLEWVENKQQIKYAIKGTTLISDLVNMASHAYSASIDDFYYDAKNNKGGITLETILVDSIKLAIPHMFDGKNYNKQNRNYFKTKEEHIEAKNEFQTKISDCNQIGIIKKYLNKYFFKTKIEISGLKKHSIGYDRETPTKLIILYTELILNALKNVSYLDKDQREVSISIGLSDDLKFLISNSYNKRRKIKTTGLGKYFVIKMVKGINGEPVFTDNDIYTAEIILPNLWEKK